MFFNRQNRLIVGAHGTTPRSRTTSSKLIENHRSIGGNQRARTPGHDTPPMRAVGDTPGVRHYIAEPATREHRFSDHDSPGPSRPAVGGQPRTTHPRRPPVAATYASRSTATRVSRLKTRLGARPPSDTRSEPGRPPHWAPRSPAEPRGPVDRAPGPTPERRGPARPSPARPRKTPFPPGLPRSRPPSPEARSPGARARSSRPQTPPRNSLPQPPDFLPAPRHSPRGAPNSCPTPGDSLPPPLNSEPKPLHSLPMTLNSRP